MTYRISVRVNMTPETAGRAIDVLAPIARECGLGFRNGIPGLLEGEVAPEQLATLVERVSSLAADVQAGWDLAAAGAIDDVWVHVQRIG